MYSSDLIGKEVVGAEGWNIGKVRELVVDKERWTVTGLSVGLESNVAKAFNLKKMWGAGDLAIPVAHVQAAGDRIILKIPKSQIAEIAKTAAGKPGKAPVAEGTSGP